MNPLKASAEGRRRLVAWTALALALILLLVGSLTVWVKRQALDTDRWVEASSRLLADDEVRALAASELVDALFSGTDAQQRIAQRLPPELQALAAPLAGLVRQAAVPAAEELLSRPAARALWEEANRGAHQRLIALLDEDDSGLLTSAGGDVVLDLTPLVDRLGARLGITPELPAGAGRVTVLSSESLGAAQDGVRAIRTLSTLLLVLVAGLVVLAVAVARGFRRRVLLALAGGLLGVGALLLVARRLAGDAVVEALTEPATRGAGTAVWLIGTELLHDIALGLVLYGLVLLVGVWLAGPARRAVAARRRLLPVARDHAVPMWGAVAAAFAAVLIWGPSAGSRRLLGILVLAALVVAGVELLRRQIVRESSR